MKKNKNRIVVLLTGIPGSGKTTLGKIVANKMNFVFIDGIEIRRKCGETQDYSYKGALKTIDCLINKINEIKGNIILAMVIPWKDLREKLRKELNNYYEILLTAKNRKQPKDYGTNIVPGIHIKYEIGNADLALNTKEDDVTLSSKRIINFIRKKMVKLNIKTSGGTIMTSGEKKIQWVESKMKILNTLYEELKNSQPFSGIKIGMSIHLEAKTAYLAYILHKLGGEVRITGSNPLTTQDDVAKALAERGVGVFAKYGIDEETYKGFHKKILENNPDYIVDDGADLGAMAIENKVGSIKGSCEETTTGVLRYKAMEKDGSLPFPVFAVNDAMMKYLFDNRYGTGQSTWDGVMRTTNMSVAGKTVVVCGYGWCGKGVALRAKGLGANVVICEVDPIKAVEAVMDGFRIMKIEEAAKIGDFFLTLTGDINVIAGKSIENLKDGAILANAGHFDVEISKKDLERMSNEWLEIKPNIREYRFKDGRKIYLLADGRLVNLAAGDGHPVEIMDLSFSVQLLSLLYHKEHPGMDKKVFKVPEEIDNKIAKIWLKSYGYEIDELTEEQKKYINSWK